MGSPLNGDTLFSASFSFAFVTAISSNNELIAFIIMFVFSSGHI